MVLCRYGFVEFTNEYKKSITITLDTWKYKRVYTFVEEQSGTACTPLKIARMERWEPSLNEYERDDISDTVPEEWKKAIEEFYCSHNHISPNTKYLAKRTHPVYSAQTETKPRIYCYKLWDQLWSQFEKT